MRAYSLTVSGSTIVSGSIEATGDMTASEDFLVKGSTKVAEYIYHQGDNDTFLRFRDNRVNLTAGGKSAIHYDSSAGKIVINNSNEDVDFHVMAEDNSELLTTDAANNRVGINTTTPSNTLTVAGKISGSYFLSNEPNTVLSPANLLDIKYQGASQLIVRTDGVISGSAASTGSFGTVYTVGKVGIGNTAPPSTLTVEGTISSSGTITSAALTAGRVLFNHTAGLIKDEAGLTWVGSVLQTDGNISSSAYGYFGDRIYLNEAQGDGGIALSN